MIRKVLPVFPCLLLLALTPAPPEAVSLTGKPLYPPELTAAQRSEFEAKLQEARAIFKKKPHDPDAAIWLGRRIAYLGRYQEAIQVFTDAIRKFPDHAALYRHRGHRYLTIRKIDLAIQDLEKAAELIQNRPDEVEPDGLPNSKNIPRSTTNSNIWYHLGLAYYVKHDFAKAETAYRECLRFCKNDDMLTATSHWLYMTLRRQRKENEAAEVLKPIREKMDVLENTEYHELLLLYQGARKPESLTSEGGDSLSSATLGYGLGNWYFYNGQRIQAWSVFEKIVAGNQWPAFGYLAAEAELAAEGRR